MGVLRPLPSVSCQRKAHLSQILSPRCSVGQALPWHAGQVRLELQAGHSELGVARVQAALEYACLAPPALPGAQPYSVASSLGPDCCPGQLWCEQVHRRVPSVL